MDSVNRYSFTVYDINIGDINRGRCSAPTPSNEDKPLPVRARL